MKKNLLLPIFKYNIINIKAGVMSNSFTNDPKIVTEPPDYDKDLASGAKANNNSKIHKRIDELLEKKRLKDLLDDTDDWFV